MSGSLNVIALISGGKDSLYSILHCIQNDHKIVALANLHPRSSKVGVQDAERVDGAIVINESEDIDSFMYQTVGHSIIPLYAEALQLPLYRRAINGSAVQTSRDYGYAAPGVSPPFSTSSDLADLQQDETEDLVPLLQKIIEEHPEANALSTGAIQSTYQRTRVESVALRLGLTPLAYLWQYPTLPRPVGHEDSLTSLLDDMYAAGCQSRIIKIASGGIRESLLWSDVSDPKTRRQLLQGLSRFFDEDELGLRGAVLGEGGEFETLALSGPKSLWKGGEIVIDDSDWAIQTGEGGASFVKITKAKVLPHSTTDDVEREVGARQPAILDSMFQHVHKLANSGSISINAAILSTQPRIPGRPAECNLSYQFGSSSVYIANITHVDMSPSSSILAKQEVSPSSTLPASAQIDTIVTHQIPTLLAQVSKQHHITPPLSSSSIIGTVLLLNSISDFAAVNPIYSRLFDPSIPNPPSRVTFATPLPKDIQVMMSITLDLGQREHRRGLHIQGRSYWAPANIGPYSQAIAVALTGSNPTGPGLNSRDAFADNETSDNTSQRSSFEVVHIAGQIPLVPASMDLLHGSFEKKAILALQHLWRIGQERKVDQWNTSIALVAETPQNLSGKENDLVDKTEFNNVYDKATISANIWTQAYLISARARAALKAQQATADGIAEDDDDSKVVDIWDLQHNPAYRSAHPPYSSHAASSSQIDSDLFHPPTHIHALPGINLNLQTLTPVPALASTSSTTEVVFLPPFLAIEVTALPRNAEIEWWSTGFTGLAGLNRSGATAVSGTHERVQWIEGEIFQGLVFSRYHRGSSVRFDEERRTTSMTSFLTCLIPASRKTSRDADETTKQRVESDGPRSIDAVLTRILENELFAGMQHSISGTTFVATGSSFDCTHGGTEGHGSDTGHQGDVALSIIPCHGIWGRLGGRVEVTTADGDGDMSNGMGEALTELEGAVVLRIDSVIKR